MKKIKNLLRTLYLFIMIICLGFLFTIFNIKESYFLDVFAEEVVSETIKESSNQQIKLTYIDDFEHKKVNDSTFYVNNIIQVINRSPLGIGNLNVWNFQTTSSDDDGWIILKSDNGPIYLNTYTIWGVYSEYKREKWYNVKGWKILGSNSYDETTNTCSNWTLVDYVSDSGFIERKDTYNPNNQRSYTIKNNDKSYEYYKFIFYPFENAEISGVLGIYLYGTKEFAVIDGTDDLKKDQNYEYDAKYEGYAALFDGYHERTYKVPEYTYEENWTQFKSKISPNPYFIVKFPDAVVMRGNKIWTSYLTSENDSENIYKWEMYGSDSYDPENINDGWVKLANFEDPNLFNSVYEYDYRFENTRGYQYYKVVITKNDYPYDSEYVKLAEYKFLWTECEHNYVRTVDEKSCTVDAYDTTECTKCHAIKNRTLIQKATGHKLEFHRQCDASYFNAGVKQNTYHCTSFCNGNYSDDQATNRIGTGDDYIIPQFTVSFTAIDGKDAEKATENYDKLLDGLKTETDGTKYCINISSNPFIIIRADKEVMLKGYKFFTANDAATYPGRNPRSWVVYGATEYWYGTKEGNWEELARVTDNTALRDKNYSGYDFAIPTQDGLYPYKSYNYFKFEFIANQNNDDGLMQLSEIELQYQVCNHNNKRTIIKEAICFVGEAKDVCSKCGYTKTITLQPTQEHNFSEFYDEVSPTCENDGVVAHKKCLTCLNCFDERGYWIIPESLSIPKLNHKYGLASYSMVDENTKMRAKRVCEHNSDHVETEDVLVTPDIIQNQTCELDEIANFTGIFTKSYFGTHKIENVVTKLKGHDYLAPTYKWIENNTKVEATRVCSRDSSHKETEIANVKTSITVKKTCEDDELSTFTAEFDNPAFQTQNKINVFTGEKLGHQYDEPIYELIENNTKMKAKRICINDSSHFEEETASVETTIVQNQTCTQDEKTDFKAIFKNPAFGTYTIENIITKTKSGHSYGNVTYELIENNQKMRASRTCLICNNYTETEDSITSSTVSRKSTCELDELSTFKATFENLAFGTYEIKDIKTDDALGHDYDDPIYELIENNTKMVATRTCKRDSKHVETETANTTGVISQNKSCTEDELTDFSATFNNQAFGTYKIKAIKTDNKTGHDYQSPTYEWIENDTKVVATRTCGNNENHFETETAIVKVQVTQNKSCTLDELSKYTVEFKNENFLTQTKENVVTGLKEHRFGTPSYQWSSDNKTVIATHQCLDCEFEETEAADVTIDVIIQKTCIQSEISNLKATFKNPAFEDQIKKNVKTANKLGHNVEDETYIWKDTVLSTCKTKGSIGHYECQRCHQTFDENHQLVKNIKLPLTEHTFDDEYDTICNICDYKRIIFDYSGYEVDGLIKNFDIKIYSGYDQLVIKKDFGFNQNFYIFNSWNPTNISQQINLNQNAYFLPDQYYSVYLLLEIEGDFDSESLNINDFVIVGNNAEVIKFYPISNDFEILLALPKLTQPSKLNSVPELTYEVEGIQLNNVVNQLEFNLVENSLTIPYDFEILFGTNLYEKDAVTDIVYNSNDVYYLYLYLFAPENYSFNNFDKTKLEIKNIGNPDEINVYQSQSVLLAVFTISLRTTKCEHNFEDYHFLNETSHYSICTLCNEILNSNHIYDEDNPLECKECSFHKPLKIDQIELVITGYEENQLLDNLNVTISEDTNQEIMVGVFDITNGNSVYNSHSAYTKGAKFVHTRDYAVLLFILIPDGIDYTSLTPEKLIGANIDFETTYFAFYENYDGINFFLADILLPRLESPSNPITIINDLEFNFEGFKVNNTIDDLTLALNPKYDSVTYEYFILNDDKKLSNDHQFKLTNEYVLELEIKAKTGYELFYINDQLITINNVESVIDYEYDIDYEAFFIQYKIIPNDLTHEHSYNEIYQIEYDYHYLVCECGKESNHQKHQYGLDSFECKICGYKDAKFIDEIVLSLDGYQVGNFYQNISVESSTIGVAPFSSNQIIISPYESALIFDMRKDKTLENQIFELDKNYYLTLIFNFEEGYTLSYENFDEIKIILEGYECKIVFCIIENSVVAAIELPKLIGIHNHSGIWNEIVQPTCTNKGTKAHFKCTICNKYFDKENNEITDLSLPLGEHQYGTWIEETSSTCSTNGTKAHKDCTVCKKHFDAENDELTDLSLPYKEHQESNWIIDDEVTLNHNGSKHTECLVCGKTIKVETIYLDQVGCTSCDTIGTMFFTFFSLLAFVLIRRRK